MKTGDYQKLAPIADKRAPPAKRSREHETDERKRRGIRGVRFAGIATPAVKQRHLVALEQPSVQLTCTARSLYSAAARQAQNDAHFKQLRKVPLLEKPCVNEDSERFNVSNFALTFRATIATGRIASVSQPNETRQAAFSQRVKAIGAHFALDAAPT